MYRWPSVLCAPRSSEHVEQKLTLQSPGIMRPIPSPPRFHPWMSVAYRRVIDPEGCSVGHEVRRSRWCAVDRAWFPCGSEGEEACTCALVWSVAVAVADRVPVASAGLAAGFGVAEEGTPRVLSCPP
ncbi:hypothetical protein HPB47_020055 [Ixodes persulcatus]|uniref:Uncharacterized protein n=1 Tax=Ixodes persulcatus TaxID=34615 RepID=A0AC60QHE3_IXOPE|nr:hypothetical protein HPB47_020055 [Ixodes persulcatus]